MTAFACGFGGGLDDLVTNMIITLITISVSALVLVVAVVAAIARRFKSGGSE
jgi:hypothetical protein